jgi:hypothetical protein
MGDVDDIEGGDEHVEDGLENLGWVGSHVWEWEVVRAVGGRW